MEYYAHSREDLPEAEWQLLDEHLENVASWAECFAAKIGAAAWGRILGKLHDIGKYRTEVNKAMKHTGPIIREEYMTLYEQTIQVGIEKGTLLEKQDVLIRLLSRKFGLTEEEKAYSKLEKGLDEILFAESKD